MATLEQYRKMLTVNRHRLDEELELQSMLMDQIASSVARFNSQQLEAKEDLAKVEARIFLELKEDKVSNEAANAEVRKHRERITAWQRYQIARQEYEEWQGLLNAWTSRGYHIKTLADLYIAQYFTAATIHGPEDTNIYASRAALSAAREAKRVEREPTPPPIRRRSLT